MNLFKGILKGKAVIVGIGNIMRADDGAGPAIIEKLKGRLEAVCIDAGVALENFTGKIKKENPDTVLIIDALHLNKIPGEYEILREEDILKTGFSTHNISPHMFIEYLRNETKASIYVLGIQPESIFFKPGLSEKVKRAVEEIAKLLCTKRT